GQGTFQLTSSVVVGANPVSIVTGDFTGDGHLDLAVADANANDVSVLLGTGDGMFQAAIHSETGSGVILPSGVPAGTTPLDLVAADFHGDGRLDLATGNGGSNDISILLGKGDGTFEEPAANAVGNSAVAVATG